MGQAWPWRPARNGTWPAAWPWRTFRDGAGSATARAGSNRGQLIAFQVLLRQQGARDRTNKEVLPQERGRDPHDGGAQERGHDVDGSDQVAAVLSALRFAGSFDEQRYVHSFLVERRAVPPATVLQEFLSVVGRERNDRPIVHAAVAHSAHEEIQLGIEIANLARVEVAQVLDPFRRR